jgi:hypothetical protein
MKQKASNRIRYYVMTKSINSSAASAHLSKAITVRKMLLMNSWSHLNFSRAS